MRHLAEDQKWLGSCPARQATTSRSLAPGSTTLLAPPDAKVWRVAQASFWSEGHRALETSRGIRSSITSRPAARARPARPDQGTGPSSGPPLQGAPAAQRALVHTQIPRHLRDRPTGLKHQLNRALLEVLA